MCTVTFIPTGEKDFILTTNRDEQPSRSPEFLTKQIEGDLELLFPRDIGAGGTWVVASNKNRLLTVLNGAFEQHVHNPPYRRSRGLMVLDFFQFSTVEDFFRDYSLRGIEPFTLVIYEEDRLYELRWNGQESFINPLHPQSFHIWSSATLYSPDVQARRAKWFWDWLANRDHFNPESVMELHRTGGDGDPETDYVMKRGGMIQTVSITCIAKVNNAIELTYHDLIKDRVSSGRLTLEAQMVPANPKILPPMSSRSGS